MLAFGSRVSFGRRVGLLILDILNIINRPSEALAILQTGWCFINSITLSFQIIWNWFLAVSNLQRLAVQKEKTLFKK